MAFNRYRHDYVPPADATTEGARYVPDAALAVAVNTAIAAEQPLLVVGEPGTGKTTLAESIAHHLGAPLWSFHCRSDHQANDVLYRFDSIRRLYDAQTQSEHARRAENYVQLQALGEAIRADREAVVLIDEIDKAPRDFPNDLLAVMDRMEFVVRETGEVHRGTRRPVVVITSNSERQLPDPFLRRCVFHVLRFPEPARLETILKAKYAARGLSDGLARSAVQKLMELRDQPGLEKRPATGELVVWVKVLLRAGVEDSALATDLRKLPYLGALLKTERDLGRFIA
jgi:MoxR-like ATPase